VYRDSSGTVPLTYESLSGPPGFVVEKDGLISYLPGEDAVGRWRVSVRIDQGGRPHRWSGFELDVWPREGTASGPVVESVEPVPASRVVAARHGILAGQGCFVALGAAAGVGQAHGTFWQNVGQPEVRGSVSPHGSLACSGGSPTTQWIAGLDSAPFLVWPQEEHDGRYALAAFLGAQVGGEKWKMGPLATAGAVVAGFGLRFQWLPPSTPGRRPLGFEARATWLAPGLAVAGSAGFLWRL
jgi:hypothetical protein